MEGWVVSVSQLCRWFGVPRRTVYYRPTKALPKVRPELAEPIKALIEQQPSFGYRTVAGLLGMNKNTVQRIFQIKGWQVRKRAIGHRPRIEALPSVATAPDQHWTTDLCRVWGGRDGWLTLALVIDCHSRELRGWQLSSSGSTTTAAAALEQVLISRYGGLGRARPRSCCAPTMAWSSPVDRTPGWCAATSCNRSSSRRTVRSTTVWSSASSGP
jgi:putative transposase